MGVKWTEEQQQVIDTRHGNLLVSAAAGSGKTAVLIEHIFSMISDPSDPVNVTELLVVTFTKAAAAEMRSRLRSRLDDAVLKDPENVHLRRQTSLLGQAHICTIDSFCQWVVRMYFHQLDIDPDFRTADDTENRLLMEDVLEKVMQNAYEEADPDFLHFMDAFGDDSGDTAVRQMVIRLYRFADSAPWPEEWLADQSSRCELPEENPAVPNEAPRELPAWILEIADAVREELLELSEILRDAAEEAGDSEGLGAYEEMFRLDERFVRELAERDDAESVLSGLDDIPQYYQSARKPTLRLSKKNHFNPVVKERLSGVRDEVKKRLIQIGKQYVCRPEEEERRLCRTSPDRRVLIRLTLAFSAAYREEKRRRNLMTFGDIEHLALQLFVSRKDGHSVPTALADSLGSTFREIIVDEYQDSNLVQETILRALSGERRGAGNMFMVGDVKQSIYKFRMARPELFMEKYRAFGDSKDAPEGRRIDLSRNFRSRTCVLRSVNVLFRQIMRESCGGIDYDERAELYPGASYPEPEPEPELLLADAGSCEGQPEEIEALMTAEKIHSLMDPDSGMKVYDSRTGEYRPLKYRDIVILLRSTAGWADTMVRVLGQAGIPAYAQLKNGYYSAREVQVLLNFLRILDNPFQDIPLASVLLSPIGGFTQEELAMMTAGMPGGSFFHRLEEGAAQGRNSMAWARFRDRLDRYRKLSSRPIHETLSGILEETDYRRILAAQPGGRVRTANADMLLAKAMAFEETSYHGIFQFLRYIDRLQKYQEDEGEAQVLSENEDLVRITTIHQSKGLEYPVVFVCGCGRKFNDRDSTSPMLIHEDLGLACDYTDTRRHVRYPVLWRSFVADRIRSDSRGEELRILYVALTRAKEKLILTGTCQNAAEKTAIPAEPAPRPTGRQIRSAGNFLDWIFLAGQSAGREIFRTRIFSGSEVQIPADQRAEKQQERLSAWLSAAASPAENESRVKKFSSILNYRYPYAAVCWQKGTYSVSELKKNGQNPQIPAQENGVTAASQERSGESLTKAAGENLSSISISAEASSGLSARTGGETLSGISPGKSGESSAGASGGAERGTAYHRALQLIPARGDADEAYVRQELDELVKSGEMTAGDRKMIHPGDLAAYYRSDLGRLAAEAEKKDRLWREQPFVMSLPLRQVLAMKPDGTDPAQVPEDEWVLVQGIIDGYAETDRGIILWDYKTDRVPRRNGAQILLGRYREQLLLYKDAIERARGEKVAEMWIYSFSLRRAVPVEEERKEI